MNKEDIDDLINNLISLQNGTMDLETFNQILICNYTDINRNSYFHFLTAYSFKEFCIRNNKLNIGEKINFEKYTKIKSEYKQQIIFFIQTLLELNCDLLLVNNNNQSPLLLSINNNNYIMSKEYLYILQNLGIYTNEDYYDFLEKIIKNGNCFDLDCLELINLILSNIEAPMYKLSENLISLCSNFSKNIFAQYNVRINIVSLEYIDKDDKNNFMVKKEENIIQNIKNKSFKIINEYINNNFLPILMKFIKLGASLEHKKESAFIYLMTYPFIPDLPKFVQENKIDINFKNESGNTPMINLINNKEYIIQISKDVYDKAFKYLIDNINIDMSKSAFYLCLTKNYLEDSKAIYNKFKNIQNSNFNPIILNYFIENKNPEKIVEFLEEFKDIIDFNLFNFEQKRSLIHYICLYLSDDINTITEIFSFIDKNLKIDYLLKDEYERNFLFYLFLDQNEKRKKTDPIQLLMHILEKYKFNDLNEKDIFENNLLFYAVQSGASLCVDYLLNNGVILSKEQKNNENSVFSVSLLKKEVQLFYFLYDKIKDPCIFNHKVYKPYKVKKYINYNDFDLDNCQKGKTLYDFLNKYNFDQKEYNNNLCKNNKNFNILYNNFINNLNNLQTLNNGISNSQSDFNFFNFLGNDVLLFLCNYTINIIIKLNYNNTNINENNINLKDNPILGSFTKNIKDYIFGWKNSQKKIISDNLILYSIMKNYEDIIRFSFNEKYNPISICNNLISFQRYPDLKNCFLRILSQNNNEQDKLLNLTDEKGQTIYHLLPFMNDNLFFLQKIENHNISNIYDKEGNTPMFNACKNFNINFIRTFSHYSFDSSENGKNNVNYNLFLETKNSKSKTPLEVLYEQLNKKNNKLLKIIIDISLNTRKIIVVPLIKYLIENYHPKNNEIFKLNYQTNLNSDEYIKKLVGLYQFYTNELKGNIMTKDEWGNDPFFICVQNNNYDFLFNVLIEERNIILNSTNNEGKSIIHLLLQISDENKKNILTKALKSGFDFNIRDNDGLLPLDYALHEGEGNNEIISLLKEYYDKFGLEFKPNTEIKIKNKIIYNYNKDSDTFYNESISVSMNIDKNENLNGLVSPLFKYDPLMSFYQVCVDEESSIPFSANLLKKDFNNLDIKSLYDKKYCIQVIKDLNKDDEYLTIAIDNHNLKTFTFKDFKLAKQKFKDLFKELTANDWDNIKYNKLNFRTDYKKYYIFDYTYEEEYAIYEYLKITIKNLYIKQQSEYENKKIKNLIYYLLVKSYKNKFSIDENTLNIEQNTKNIIEKYKSTAINKAISILFNLKKLLNSNNKDEIYFRKKNYLINSYNDLIPYFKKLTNFNEDNLTTDDKIDDEISRLTNYYYIENVLKIFLGAIYNLNNIHPLDYIIKALGCKIEELPKPQNNNSKLTTETDYIYNYVFSTNEKKVPITAIYKITESVNDKNFNLKNYDNRYIFFHGTKVENVIGILSQGLKIAPVQAIYTGSMLGNGIYLSDNFSCSLQYCDHLLKNVNSLINYDGKKFMFMAEVAVGKIGKDFDADTSVANMTMNFNDYYVTDEGCRIFKNSNQINCGFGIIVAHEETNVRIKYLIEIN